MIQMKRRAATTLAAGLILGAVALTPLAGGPAHAADYNYQSWQNCNLAVPARVPVQVLVVQMQRRGFTNVRPQNFVTKKYRNANPCGFYRVQGRRNGKLWMVYADVAGRIIGARSLANATLNQQGLRRALRQQGYRNIDDIKRINRGGRVLWFAKAGKGGKRWQLIARPTDGRVLQQSEIRDAIDTAAKLRQHLRGQGYRQIRNIARRARNNQITWRASAQKGGRDVTVITRASDGRILRVTASAQGIGTEAALRQQLRRDGYRQISGIRKISRNNRVFWVAEANKGGKRWRLVVRGSNGDIANRREVRQQAFGENQLRQALRQQGYRRINDINKVQRNNQTRWFAKAEKGGKRWQLMARDGDGRVLRRQQLRDPQISQQQLIQRLQQQGFTNISNVELVTRNNTRFYRAIGVRNGKRWGLVARATDGRIVRRQAIGNAQISEQQFRQALARQGYANPTRIEQVSRNNQSFWRAVAEKGGDRYLVVARATDGRIVGARKLGPVALSEQQVRQQLRQQGYRRIRDLEKVTRNNVTFWRANAVKDGKRYQLFARATDGRVVRARETGAVRLSERQIRRQLARAGYTNVAWVSFSDRSGREVYRARGEKDGKVWVLILDAATGNVLRRREMAPRHASANDVRGALRGAGYQSIDDIREGTRQGQKVWLAHAWQDGVRYRIRVDWVTGRPVNRVRIGGRLTETEIERILERNGWREVSVFRWQADGRAGVYTAVGRQGGGRFRLVVKADSGDVVRRDALARRQPAVEVIRRIAAAAGYRHLGDLKWIAAQGLYQGTAWQQGHHYRLWVRAHDNKVVRRERIGGRLPEAQIRQRLGQAGYSGVTGLRFVDDGRAGHYEAVAERGNEKYQLVVSSSTGQPVRTTLLSKRISEAELTEKLMRAGYEKVAEVGFQRDDSGGHYEADAWKNGRKYRVHARAADGTEYRRVLVSPRASATDVEDKLFDEGYDNVADVKFVEDDTGGHFEATARRNGRKYKVWCRAHDGSLYHRDEIQ